METGFDYTGENLALRFKALQWQDKKLNKRRRRKLTQKWLAKQIGENRGMVCDVLNGQHDYPRIKEKIIKQLNKLEAELKSEVSNGKVL